MKNEITLFSERIDAVCNAAIESSDAEDLPSLAYVLSIAVTDSESALGYGYDLVGELDEDGCIEGPRLGFWDERIRPICEMAVRYEQHVALALALHRAQWFLGRVRIFGPDRYG